ncbi:hypothetical protein ZWY2020_044093 [Hordeum vulgare]|nr:hypothetical protein ZWY2020_044093 [Hordeum vulgare]
MFQHLALENSIDNCGYRYTICLDLKHQRLTSHAEFFVRNLKEMWNRHYRSSKVQIIHFPIEYVLTDKQGNSTYDCTYYVLEYLAMWEGRKSISKASVDELRKILVWNWVTNGDFNKWP